MNFYTRVAVFNPMLCRLLAKDGRANALSTEQIAERSGLSQYNVEAIASLPSWEEVGVGDMRKFTAACGMDLTNERHMRRARAYVRSTPSFLYLRNDPMWEGYYRGLLAAWLKSYGTVTSTSALWPPLRRIIIGLTPKK